MKTTKCQQEKDNTAHPLTTADEDDIATVIRMLKTWQADDNFAAKDRQSDRTAWHRVAKCDKMKNEQAQELFRSAQARLDQPGSNNDLPQRALVDLMGLAAAADESGLASNMACLLTTLGSGTQTRPTTSRIRHTVNKLIAQYGPRGHAAYTIWRTLARDVPYPDRCMIAWDEAARATLRAWPAPAAEWLRVLSDPAITRSSQVTQDAINGTEIWYAAPGDQNRKGSPKALATWNVNSFFRRWARGDIAAFVAANPVDVLHVPETRGSTLRCDSYEVRSIMASQGFHWAAWSWNTSNESHHGSAVF